jgi:hypothetical protein
MCVSLSRGPVAASAYLRILTASYLAAPLCRAALTRGASPDLAAALDGVTHAKLFLAGEEVADQTVQQLLDTSAFLKMIVVLPVGQGRGLGLTGPAAPALKLPPRPDPPA